MLEWFTENMLAIVTLTLGSGGLLGWFVERKKRMSLEKGEAADALKTMQSAYDKFTQDFERQYDELRNKVKDLEEKIHNLMQEQEKEREKFSQMLSVERKKYKELEAKYSKYISSIKSTKK